MKHTYINDNPKQYLIATTIVYWYKFVKGFEKESKFSYEMRNSSPTIQHLNTRCFKK